MMSFKERVKKRRLGIKFRITSQLDTRSEEDKDETEEERKIQKGN